MVISTNRPPKLIRSETRSRYTPAAGVYSLVVPAEAGTQRTTRQRTKLYIAPFARPLDACVRRHDNEPPSHVRG